MRMDANPSSMSRNIFPSIQQKTKATPYSPKEILFAKHSNSCKFAFALPLDGPCYGGCSSVVEQRVVAPLAAGSIPVTRPRSSTYVELFAYRADSPDSAQWFSCSIWREACMRLLYDHQVRDQGRRINHPSCSIHECNTNHM